VLMFIGVFGFTLVLLVRFAPAAARRVPTEAFSTTLSLWIFGVLSIAAIATGATSIVRRLIRIGASDERRSVLANRAGRLEKDAMQWIGPAVAPNARSRRGDGAIDLPNVPTIRALTDSPGERLDYRLAAEPSGDGVAGTAVLAILWNTVWFVLLAVAVSGIWYGRPRWVLTGMLVPFAFLGYRLWKSFLTTLRKQAGIGPTIVEISQHPLFPGESFDLFVAQRGRMRLRRLSVHLVCEEETFYRQGTDVRVERADAFSQLLHEQSKVIVDPHSTWEHDLTCRLPPDVMHSFVGFHNAIRWKIVVRGESRPWPSFCRSFPVVVHPPAVPPKPSPR